MKQAISNTSEMDTSTTLRRAKRDKTAISDRVYVLDYDDDAIRCGIMNGTIPSTVADSGCTSNVGTNTIHANARAQHPTRSSSYPVGKR